MDKDVKGRIHSIETFGAVDGPGIRFVVFFQGCPLRCVYCHNPDTWDKSGGKETTAGELLQQIKRYKSFIKNGGVTLSGGEPLMQSGFARSLLTLCEKEKLHTAVDTSGCIPLSVCAPAVDAADLILLDIKAASDTLSREITRAGNENSIALLNYCEKKGKPVWIRHVLLKDRTLDKKQAHLLGKLLSGYRCVEKAELLPFHKIGEYKWKALDIDYTLSGTPVPKREQVEEIKKILASYGIKT